MIGAWITRHLQTLVGSLGRLAAQPLATLLTTLVIAIALALPACLQVLVANARTATGDLTAAVDITVYLKKDTTAQQAEQVAARIRQRQDVTRVDLVTADVALREFREYSGFGAALEALAENPLPHALVVRPAETALGPDSVAALGEALRSLDEVELVQLDTAWVGRLQAILDTLRRAIMLAAVLLGLGVITIVGNTIRLDIENRRDEIEITKLVGGSNAFVRRPFLYSGVWYGLGGAVLAAGIVAVALLALSEPVHRLAGLYGSEFRLGGLDARMGGLLLASGIGLGWLGSWLAASRHLAAIEPR